MLTADDRLTALCDLDLLSETSGIHKIFCCPVSSRSSDTVLSEAELSVHPQRHEMTSAVRLGLNQHVKENC